MVGVNGGGTITFDSVTFSVRHAIGLYGEGNADCNLVIKQFSAVSSGTDLHRIRLAAFTLLLYF